MNNADVNVLQRKPLILYKYQFEINKDCLICKHFLFDWANRPFCGLARNIYGYCNTPEIIQSEVVDYD